MDKKPKEKSKGSTLLNMLDGLYEAGLPGKQQEPPAVGAPSGMPIGPANTSDILQQLQALPLPKRPEDEEEEDESVVPPTNIEGSF